MENSKVILKEHIYSGIMAGAERVSEYRDILNESNAFPVPDRDTGNNLSHLMQKILGDLISEGTIKDLLDDVSNLAIIGARGNSGAIFSQFFYGFSTYAPNTDMMTTGDLINCFQNGQQYANNAIEDPVEGTIITVIRIWVCALKEVFSPHKSLNQIYKEAYPILKSSVEKTKYTLKVQKKMQSEDAGAKAFLYFIEGFMPMLINRVVDYKPSHNLSFEKIDSIGHENVIENYDIKNKYCTEVLIDKASDYDEKDLEDCLRMLGDSVVISENEKMLRVHIHTNYPSKVVEMLSYKGRIIESKADNMVSQYELTKKHDKKIALVIDSIADIDSNRLSNDTYLLPINILVDDVSYEDKVTVIPKMISPGSASSSQPNKMQTRRFLAPILESYDDVIIITVSSKMSGVYNRFHDVIEEIIPSSNVHLIDSKQNSVAEGLVVDYALKFIAEGLSATDVKSKVEDVIKRSKIYVSLPNLKGMVSSGRLNENIGKFLQVTGFLPLISINDKGEGVTSGVAFSKKGNQKLLLERIKTVKNRIESFAVVHSENYESAKKIADEITEVVGKEPLYIDEISSVIKLFSGPGSIAIGYVLGEDK